MANIEEELDRLLKKARADADLRRRLLATREAAAPLTAFCEVANEAGCQVDVMGLIEEGESSYAAMKRSTNGGGENSPLLEGQDDEYTLFLASIESIPDDACQEQEAERWDCLE